MILPFSVLAGTGMATVPSAPSRPAIARSAQPSDAAAWAMLRKRIKHIFVIYQENRSFDHYFGTYPGAEGLFTHPADQTPGFYESFIGVDGNGKSVHPFSFGPKEYAADLDDVDHSHEAILSKMDFQNGVARMDRFAAGEERVHARQGTPNLKAVQYGELAMAYVDGDTIPFIWRYASRFVLCDHIFQSMTGPSTPGNLAIFAGQTGVTQSMLHPDQDYGSSPYAPGVPVLNDPNPFWGSAQDSTKVGRMPANPHDNPKYTPEYNLTFANIAYTLTGGALAKIAQSDRDPKGDLSDTRDDVSFITRQGKQTISWGWFEEGFDREPTDTKSDDPLDAAGSHASYVTHHNGPQYFGSIANNPKMSRNLKGLADFYREVATHTLPDKGLFYVKGGFENQMGLHPACPEPKVQKNFVGDDDHPGYSDSQISEAMVARTVNAIASSPYWKDSAIIITWDDSEGDYDHVRPPVETVGPDGTVISAGPRVPFLVISPYAKTHFIFEGAGTQVSVLKFADRLFGLTPLADLPDELKGRKIGEAKGLRNQGPQDDLTPGVSDLLGVFDLARVRAGMPLPARDALIPPALLRVLPQQSGYGLKALGIVPTDYAKGIKNEIPADFNPRPSTVPTKG